MILAGSWAMTKFLIWIACTALTGCTIQSGQTAQQPQSGQTAQQPQSGQTAQQPQSQLVGMTKEGVLNCVGTPLQKAMEGQSEVWSYASGNDHRCTVNVVLVFGRVSQVNYSGPTGERLPNGDQCAFAVQDCVLR
jgi:outer membrane protein assembly factor BamE (lipoprotein component of BamABCDE complex)